jgi:hypothetical protein
MRIIQNSKILPFVKSLCTQQILQEAINEDLNVKLASRYAPNFKDETFRTIC